MDTQNNQSIIQFTNPELVESIFMEIQIILVQKRFHKN